MVAIYVLMAILGAAVAVFALQNLDPVVIRFIGWHVQGMPLAVVVLLSVLAGLTFASLVGVIQHFKLRRRIRQLQLRLQRAEAAAPAPTGSRPPSDRGLP